MSTGDGVVIISENGQIRQFALPEGVTGESILAFEYEEESDRVIALGVLQRRYFQRQAPHKVVSAFERRAWVNAPNGDRWSDCIRRTRNHRVAESRPLLAQLQRRLIDLNLAQTASLTIGGQVS